MKGIGHFLSGMTVATCFPVAVESAAAGNPFYILLGAMSGLVSDTVDFRLCRYVWRHDYTVCPGVEELDPEPAAETIARAIDEAHQKQKMVSVKLHTMKVSANYWRTYSVFIDPAEKKVTARIGPLRTLGQVMGGGGCLPESAPEKERIAVRSFSADVVQTYDAETKAEIFSGPDFAFVPDRGRVRVDFIPWHRIWTHSFTIGTVWGFIFLLLLGNWASLFSGDIVGFFSATSCTAALIATLGFWTHVVIDQSGRLGCNLFYPFTKKRTVGMGLTRSGGVVENFFLCYMVIATMVWNLNAYAPKPAFVMPWAASMKGNFSDPGYYLISLANYVLYFVIIPLGLLYGLITLHRKLYPALKDDDPNRSAVDNVGELGTE